MTLISLMYMTTNEISEILKVLPLILFIRDIEYFESGSAPVFNLSSYSVAFLDVCHVDLKISMALI